MREKTLQSTAPEMVYEEGDIIKRAIRDLYSKDIDEIQIDGTKTYQNAKRFMRLMMPSHAKRVQEYRDEAIPLFQRFQIEQHLDGMNHPEVLLKSGGYIVISPTEALVAIDAHDVGVTGQEIGAIRTPVHRVMGAQRGVCWKRVVKKRTVNFKEIESSGDVGGRFRHGLFPRGVHHTLRRYRLIGQCGDCVLP